VLLIGKSCGHDSQFLCTGYKFEIERIKYMDIKTDKMLAKLSKVAKIGARNNVEVSKVRHLDPVAIMATKPTEEIKVVKIVVSDGFYMKEALQSCLSDHNAYAYAFVKESQGTDFPAAFFRANGDFSLIPLDDKYQFVNLQIGIVGTPNIFVSTSVIKDTINGRVLSQWSNTAFETGGI